MRIQFKLPDSEKCSGSVVSIGYSMFCVGYGIYTPSSPSVYFITNTKHCITYLALTQLFPFVDFTS